MIKNPKSQDITWMKNPPLFNLIAECVRKDWVIKLLSFLSLFGVLGSLPCRELIKFNTYKPIILVFISSTRKLDKTKVGPFSDLTLSPRSSLIFDFLHKYEKSKRDWLQIGMNRFHFF